MDVYTFLNGFASPPFLFQGPRKANIIANSLNTVVGYDLLGLPTGPVLHDASRQQLSQLVAVQQAKAGPDAEPLVEDEGDDEECRFPQALLHNVLRGLWWNAVLLGVLSKSRMACGGKPSRSLESHRPALEPRRPSAPARLNSHW